jgi:UDP-N-acetylglucosamine 2-epimerase (non-hydrolysing)
MSERQRVLSVIGTRPEAIKMAPVVRELGQRAQIESFVCVTGQHRELLDPLLELFGITADYDLRLMQRNQSPTEVAARVLLALDGILAELQPHWVLVQGDTTTAMAASLAACYRRVRVGHVEAGLRTFDKHHPFPEETNRRITGVVADLHFAPTARARQNLLNEGERDGAIRVTGNSVIDALQLVASMSDAEMPAIADATANRRVVLVTAHRRENFGQPLEAVCDAIESLTKTYAGDVHFVDPVHPNPMVRRTVMPRLCDRPGITLTEPLQYRELVTLLKRSTLVLTDSGGIQEEAPGLGKPVLVLRDVTERPEAVEAGTVELVGTDSARIVAATRRLLDDATAYARMARAINPYGDGRAAIRIADALCE